MILSGMDGTEVGVDSVRGSEQVRAIYRQDHELTYLQAHHLELEFYDHHFGPGAYLHTHAEHMARWHQEGGGG